jgi:hypothetical protein
VIIRGKLEVGVGRYASNNLDAYERPKCLRCGSTSECDWTDDTRFGEPVHVYRPSRHWCNKPGCVDENGYNTVPPREVE